MMALAALLVFVQAANVPALDNPFVQVMRGSAPCATASAQCMDRVIVALGTIELRAGGTVRRMLRGDVAVFRSGQSYAPPTGDYYEVAFKVDRPAAQRPAAAIAPEKNETVYDGAGLFVFREQLNVGDIRPRHSHSHRVVVQLNQTRLRQWPDGSDEVLREQIPDRVGFNEPVVHRVENAGPGPLRNIVIELKP